MVGKGILPVKHIAPKTFMAVNYCGHQLARRLWLAALAYHGKEDAVPHIGARRHSLRYDGWSYGRFGVCVVTWKLGSQGGKGEFMKN